MKLKKNLKLFLKDLNLMMIEVNIEKMKIKNFPRSKEKAL